MPEGLPTQDQYVNPYQSQVDAAAGQIAALTARWNALNNRQLSEEERDEQYAIGKSIAALTLTREQAREKGEEHHTSYIINQTGANFRGYSGTDLGSVTSADRGTIEGKPNPAVYMSTETAEAMAASDKAGPGYNAAIAARPETMALVANQNYREAIFNAAIQKEAAARANTIETPIPAISITGVQVGARGPISPVEQIGRIGNMPVWGMAATRDPMVLPNTTPVIGAPRTETTITPSPISLAISATANDFGLSTFDPTVATLYGLSNIFFPGTVEKTTITPVAAPLSYFTRGHGGAEWSGMLIDPVSGEPYSPIVESEIRSTSVEREPSPFQMSVRSGFEKMGINTGDIALPATAIFSGAALSIGTTLGEYSEKTYSAIAGLPVPDRLIVPMPGNVIFEPKRTLNFFAGTGFAVAGMVPFLLSAPGAVEYTIRNPLGVPSKLVDVGTDMFTGTIEREMVSPGSAAGTVTGMWIGGKVIGFAYEGSGLGNLVRAVSPFTEGEVRVPTGETRQVPTGRYTMENVPEVNTYKIFGVKAPWETYQASGRALVTIARGADFDSARVLFGDRALQAAIARTRVGDMPLALDIEKAAEIMTPSREIFTRNLMIATRSTNPEIADFYLDYAKTNEMVNNPIMRTMFYRPTRVELLGKLPFESASEGTMGKIFQSASGDRGVLFTGSRVNIRAIAGEGSRLSLGFGGTMEDIDIQMWANRMPKYFDEWISIIEKEHPNVRNEYWTRKPHLNKKGYMEFSIDTGFGKFINVHAIEQYPNVPHSWYNTIWVDTVGGARVKAPGPAYAVMAKASGATEGATIQYTPRTGLEILMDSDVRRAKDWPDLASVSRTIARDLYKPQPLDIGTYLQDIKTGRAMRAERFSDFVHDYGMKNIQKSVPMFQEFAGIDILRGINRAPEPAFSISPRAVVGGAVAAGVFTGVLPPVFGFALVGMVKAENVLGGFGGQKQNILEDIKPLSNEKIFAMGERYPAGGVSARAGSGMDAAAILRGGLVAGGGGINAFRSQARGGSIQWMGDYPHGGTAADIFRSASQNYGGFGITRTSLGSYGAAKNIFTDKRFIAPVSPKTILKEPSSYTFTPKSEPGGTSEYKVSLSMEMDSYFSSSPASTSYYTPEPDIYQGFFIPPSPGGYPGYPDKYPGGKYPGWGYPGKYPDWNYPGGGYPGKSPSLDYFGGEYPGRYPGRYPGGFDYYGGGGYHGGGGNNYHISLITTSLIIPNPRPNITPWWKELRHQRGKRFAEIFSFDTYLGMPVPERMLNNPSLHRPKNYLELFSYDTEKGMRLPDRLAAPYRGRRIEEFISSVSIAGRMVETHDRIVENDLKQFRRAPNKAIALPKRAAPHKWF